LVHREKCTRLLGIVTKVRPVMVEPLKLWVKSGKTRHQNPLFGHIRDEISKNRGEKKNTGLQEGMKLSLAANLGMN